MRISPRHARLVPSLAVLLLASCGDSSSSSQPTAPVRPGDNLVVNGSFENPRIQSSGGVDNHGSPSADDIPGWFIDEIDIVNEMLWTARNGTQSIDLNGLDAGEVEQIVATQPDKAYEIGFSYAANTGRPAPPIKIFRVLVMGTALDTVEIDATRPFAWHDTTLTFSALGDDTLKFQSLVAGNSGAVLDQITVRRK